MATLVLSIAVLATVLIRLMVVRRRVRRRAWKEAHAELVTRRVGGSNGSAAVASGLVPLRDADKICRRSGCDEERLDGDPYGLCLKDSMRIWAPAGVSR